MIEIFNGAFKDFSTLRLNEPDIVWVPEYSYRYSTEVNKLLSEITRKERSFQEIGFEIHLQMRVVWDYSIGSPMDMPDPKNNTLLFFGAVSANGGSVTIIIWAPKIDLRTYTGLEEAHYLVNQLCFIGSREEHFCVLANLHMKAAETIAELKQAGHLAIPLVQKYLIPYFVFARYPLLPFAHDGVGTIMVFPLTTISETVEPYAINNVRRTTTVLDLHPANAVAVWFDDSKKALAFKMRYVLAPTPSLSF